MKDFIEKNPKLVGGLIGLILAGLLSLAGIKMSDVCAVEKTEAPAAAPVAQ